MFFGETNTTKGTAAFPPILGLAHLPTFRRDAHHGGLLHFQLGSVELVRQLTEGLWI